jgi:hypothetical protein
MTHSRAIFITFGERNAIMTTGYVTSKLGPSVDAASPGWSSEVT